MEFEQTSLPGVVIVKPRPFLDDRGRFVKLFNEDVFRTAGLPTHYAEHYYSFSRKGVLRGLHFQHPPRIQAKLVACAQGRVLDVAVDLRANSPHYGKAFGLELNDQTGTMLFIPGGFAHGFYVLSDTAYVVYASTDVYDQKADAAIRWDSIDFPWPEKSPVLSTKDAAAPALKDFQSRFTM